MVGEHCCTYIPDGDTNLTAQHLSTFREKLISEHAQDTDWDPFSWIQSQLGVWGAKLFHWFIYGVVILLLFLLIITCVKKLCTKTVDTVLNMPLLTNDDQCNDSNDDPFNKMADDLMSI